MYSNKNKCNCSDIIGYIKNNEFEKVLKSILSFDCSQCIDEDGNQLLHYFAKIVEPISHEIISKILYKPNSNVNEIIDVQNKDGKTPILIAVENDNDAVIELLDDAGADKTIPDHAGNMIEVTESDDVDEKNSVIVALMANNKNNDDLPTLNLNDISDTSDKFVSELQNKISETSDHFIAKFRNKLKNIIKPLSTNVMQPSSNEKFDMSSVMNNTTQTDNTENFIAELRDRYSNPTEKVRLDTIQSDDKFDNDTSDNKQTDEEMDTDELIQVVNKTGPQTGGKKHRSKISGYRNMTFDSDYSMQNEYPNNELSRLVESKNDEIVKQIIDRIKDMLEKGLLFRESEKIAATDKNASLIKTYLFGYVKNKNPQLNSMAKHLQIKKMTDDEIVELVENMPDLDKLHEDITKKKDMKSTNLNSDSDKSNLESSDENMSKKKDKKEKKDKKDKKDKDKKEKKSKKEKKE